MTLDDCIRTVLAAAQPHIDNDVCEPGKLDDAFYAVKRTFAEEPNIEQAFIAAVKAIAEAARVGYVEVK